MVGLSCDLYGDNGFYIFGLFPKLGGSYRYSVDPTSMSALLIVGLRCTLAASHAAPWWVTHGEYDDGTDRRTDRRTDARPLHYVLR